MQYFSAYLIRKMT
uniref:Uncharacterized protein n=1 Tax=Romanomermis culicivorax TaxID=13658 RepID=A0A915JWQ0_ROMCU